MISVEFYERNNCSLCFGNSLMPIWELVKLPFTDTIGPYLKDYPTVDQTLVICSQCGLFQLQKVVTPEFLYDSDNYSYERVNGPKIVREGALYRNLILEMIPNIAYQRPRVLEIGGSSELFISTLIDLFNSVTIIDPAPVVSQGNNPRIEILKGFMEDNWSVLDDHKFELIICRHVIEHVSDPKFFISELLERISNDTYVIFETPNFNSLLGKTRLDAIFHQHVSYFQPETFRHLVESSGGLVMNELLLDNGSNGGVIINAIKRNPLKNRSTKLEIDNMRQKAKSSIALFHKSLQLFESNMESISGKIDGLKNGFYCLGAGSLLPTLNYHLEGRIEQSYGIIDDDDKKQGKSYKNVEIEIIPPIKLRNVNSDTCLVTSLENRKVLSIRAKEIGFNDVLCPPPLD